MATERHLNPLDEESNRLIAVRREKDGDDQVSRYLPNIYQISGYSTVATPPIRTDLPYAP